MASCSAWPQQRGPQPQPQPTWAGCSWRKRCVLQRPGTGRRISGWPHPATPGDSAGPASGAGQGPMSVDRPPAWCLLVQTMPSIPGTLPRAVCPLRPRDSLGPRVRSAWDDTASLGSLLLMRKDPQAPSTGGRPSQGWESDPRGGSAPRKLRAGGGPLLTGPGVPTAGPTDSSTCPPGGPAWETGD